MKLKIRLLNMAVPPTTKVSELPRHQDRENLNTTEWVKRRIAYELHLRDLNVELETINKLIAEYFSDK